MIILPFFVIFLVVLTYFLRKNTRIENETQEQFWEREREANSVRKQDISQLPYLTVPLDTFPLGKYDDSELSRLEQELSALSKKSILNLNGITNTELKMTYGTANLNFLSECDENFTTLIRLLHEYGSKLSELSHTAEAEAVLLYAVDSGSDISATYLLLADLYLADGKGSLIHSLIASADQLTSSRKDVILGKLKSMSIL